MMKRPYRNIGFFFLLLLVLVITGFTPRIPDMPFFGYFSQLARSGHAQIPLVIHLHAFAALAWFVLLCTQAFLMRANRDGENTIFQECRNSAAMKRVLMVWGR